MEFEKHLNRCLELATEARNEGHHPFGALLVLDGQVILEEKNTVSSKANFAEHAEMNLVLKAVSQWSDDALRRSTLFSSTEPCPMCAGAIYWAGIKSVVFAFLSVRLGELCGRDFVKVQGPFLEAQAEIVHQGFWVSRESLGETQS